ncbi:hypothetical protein HK096_007706 [Nowakowskiella sp. JEL0078]|nr:hypothetical protein HK096_007706 [Nowakowskiella sp. JEL0078]
MKRPANPPSEPAKPPANLSRKHSKRSNAAKGPFALAEGVLVALKAKKGTIKALILDNIQIPAALKKRVYGLVCESLKCVCCVSDFWF